MMNRQLVPQVDIPVLQNNIRVPPVNPVRAPSAPSMPMQNSIRLPTVNVR